MDEQSVRAMGPSYEKLKAVADELVSVPLEEQSVKQRSRSLKTTMRRWIEGDFVFLDLDTVVLQGLDGLRESAAPLGLALENNVASPSDYRPTRVYQAYDKLGWNERPARYFNSGVMYVKDCEVTHRLFADWNELWNETRSVGREDDQPSLNMAIHRSGIDVQVLPAEYNAMVLFYPWRFRTARIAHYFASNRQGGTLLTHLVDHFDNAGELDGEAIDTAREAGHPWGPNAEPYQLWRSRNYSSAIAGKLSRFVFGKGTTAKA